jgi:hypothetical protein
LSLRRYDTLRLGEGSSLKMEFPAQGHRDHCARHGFIERPKLVIRVAQPLIAAAPFTTSHAAETVAALQNEVSELKQQLAEFRKSVSKDPAIVKSNQGVTRAELPDRLPNSNSMALPHQRTRCRLLVLL